MENRVDENSNFSFFNHYHSGSNSLYLMNESLNDIDMQVICDFLRQHIQITKLYFFSCSINHSSIKLLIEYLDENDTITSFNLTGSELNGENIQSLANFLKKSKIIKEFFISRAGLHNEEVKIIVDALNGNTTLKYLALPDNAIDNEGARVLVKLAYSTKLENLNISGNNLSSELIISINNLFENRNNFRVQHEEIMHVMQALGYKESINGICIGLSSMQMQALFAEDLDTFNKHLQFISYMIAETESEMLTASKLNIHENKKFNVMLLKRLKEKIDQLHDTERTDILAFFDGVALYQDQSRYPKWFTEVIYFSGSYLNNEYTHELTEYFELLGEKLKTLSLTHPVSFFLCRFGQAINVGYNPKSAYPWTVFDPNGATKRYKHEDEKLIANDVHISPAFNCNHHAIFTTQVFSRNEDKEKISKAFTALMQNEKWKTIHTKTFKKFTLSVINKMIDFENRHHEKMLTSLGGLTLTAIGAIATPIIPSIGMPLIGLGITIALSALIVGLIQDIIK